MYQIDLLLFRWLNSWAGISPFFDWAIVFRATYLWYLVMVAVFLIMAVSFLPRFHQRQQRAIQFFIFAVVSATVARFGVTELIRLFYNRPRPFEVLEGIHQLANHVSGGSFPSGHAALAFAVATVVWFYYPKTSILFFLVALSIGMGRVAAGVHWPSDILGGALVGIFSAYLIHFLHLRYKQWKNKMARK